VDTTVAIDLGRDALVTSLVLCGPVLAIGLLVGLVISIIQTVTQIQDQTLSLVPKIVAMIGTAVFFSAWLIQRLVEYSQRLFGAT
jgi:flagellar biosynthetic protein FliQ